MRRIDPRPARRCAPAAQRPERRGHSSEQFCSDTALSVRLSCQTVVGCPTSAKSASGAHHPHSAYTRATCARVLILSTGEKETYNMQTHYPFHAEYWVYALAVFVILVLGTLLYTVDGPN